MQRTFKVDIVLVFSSLIIGTMLLITSITYYQNQKETLALADRIMSDTARSVVDATIEYLRPAQTVSRLGAELMSDGQTKARAGGGLERFFLRTLTEYPQIGLIYFADDNGNFFQVNREVADGTLTTRVIDRSVTPPTEMLRYRDASGRITRRAKSEAVTYDPRVRPWFKGATASRALFWTDIYIFNTGKMPGITAAYPAINQAEDSLTGVMAADVTLTELSNFLAGLMISERGVAFIMDERGQLIAFPGLVPVKTNGDTARPLLATEISDPWITAAVRSYIDERRERFEFAFAGESTLTFVQRFPDSFGKSWYTVVLVPVDDFLGPIKRNSLITLGLSFFILLLAIVIGLRFSRNIARPVEQLTNELNQIRDFHLGAPAQVRSYISEIQMMEGAINSMKNGLASFRRYVPADLVRELIASGEEVRPGGKERELTLLFTDIANFTPIAEEMTARETMVCLSDYFDILTHAVSETHGTVDKYIGDAVMAFWGAPGNDEEHALHCCQAVMSSIAALERFNETRFAAGNAPFLTRFGVNTGFTIVGNVGSEQRLNYTAIGDSVNLASRLEDVNRHYGTQAIISHATYRYVREHFLCRPIDLIIVKGRSAGVKIYELLCERSDETPEPLLHKAERFREGFEKYMQRDWKRALETFTSLGEEFPDDQPTRLFRERCSTYLANPPGEDWNGIWRIEDNHRK